MFWGDLSLCKKLSKVKLPFTKYVPANITVNIIFITSFTGLSKLDAVDIKDKNLMQKDAKNLVAIAVAF